MRCRKTLVLSWLYLACCVLTLAACHETQRDNLLDPVLTPGVELSVALDDTAGTATLSWTRYAGETPFAVYRVLRNVQNQVQVDTLAVLAEVDRLTFIDTTLSPDIFYDYRIAVVNEAGFAAVSPPQNTPPLNLPPVQIEALHFDARTASAALSWTPYRGPRFRAYQILRWTEGQTAQVVDEIPDSARTEFSDAGLLGNIEYFYRVVVQTARDEAIVSAEESGMFHPLLASWPLPVEEDEFVRLYWEDPGRLTALVSSKAQVRLLSFDAQGGLLAERILFASPFIGPPLSEIIPRAVTTVLQEDGNRLLGFSVLADDNPIVNESTPSTVLGLLQLDSGGAPILREYPLFNDVLPGVFTGDEGIVLGEARLTGDTPSSGAGLALRMVSIDNVAIYARGDLVFAEDFEEGNLSEWDTAFGDRVEDGRMMVRDGGSFRLVKTDDAWRQLRLEADLSFRLLGFTSLGIGSARGFSRVMLTLSPRAPKLALTWSFRSLDTNQTQRQSFETPFTFLPGVTYRPAVEMVDGQISASIQSPVIWSVLEEGVGHKWGSSASIDDAQAMAYTLGPNGYSLSADGAESRLFEFGDPALVASETRVWSVEGDAEPWVGVALLEVGQVRIRKGGFSTTTKEVRWPINLSVRIGDGLGAVPGKMIAPLSFDGTADGRVFVLDAGNARIQVFDIEGNYITHWTGRAGAGGAFDFGNQFGIDINDFAGSVAVDDEGFIYVADVGNRRIQKFAP